MPDWATLKRELGSSLTVTENPDGSLDGRVVGAEAVRRAWHMTREAARIEAEAGAARNALVETATLRDRDGNERSVPARLAERTAKRAGLHEKPRWGRATRYKRDRDGRLWKRPHGGDWEAAE